MFKVNDDWDVTLRHLQLNVFDSSSSTFSKLENGTVSYRVDLSKFNVNNAQSEDSYENLLNENSSTDSFASYVACWDRCTAALTF